MRVYVPVRNVTWLGCTVFSLSRLTVSGSRKLEPLLGSPAASVPAQRIGRQHAAGAAPLGFERKKSIPGADVEDRETGKILGHLDLG
jgi:hypothetical protein